MFVFLYQEVPIVLDGPEEDLLTQLLVHEVFIKSIQTDFASTEPVRDLIVSRPDLFSDIRFYTGNGTLTRSYDLTTQFIMQIH